MPPVAVRLRRDFKTVLMLVRAHALLHQASRQKDEEGRVIAEIEDYKAVRELVADLVAVGVDATVKPEIREVVEAVRPCLKKGRRRSVRQTSNRYFNSTSRPSHAAWLMPSMAGFSGTWRIARGGLQGSFLEIRCRITVRILPAPEAVGQRRGVARLRG